MDNNFLKEVCGRCGCTYGSHHGGTSPYPRDYCPGHEGRMDWEDGHGTVFKPTGEYLPEKRISAMFDEYKNEDSFDGFKEIISGVALAMIFIGMVILLMNF